MIDSKVVGLIRSLKSKSRGDIATLLIDCKIVLEPMIADEITSRSNVDGLILQAPPDKYRDLENLSDEDRNFILRLFLDSRLDRGTPVFGLRFDIRGDYEVLKKIMQASFLSVLQYQVASLLTDQVPDQNGAWQ